MSLNIAKTSVKSFFGGVSTNLHLHDYQAASRFYAAGVVIE
jgi:hypothetical protein